jgi:ABC-type uncharacterized transport system involved in gliding motility auxiliary subunit
MKTIPKLSHNSWKYLALFGLFLGVAGLVSGFISGVWSSVAIALSIAGLVIAIAGIGIWGSGPQGFFRQRLAREGTNALIATLSMVAILGLVNFLAVRHSVRVDLTETQLFTLSPQSKQIVANLPKPLKVFVFDPKPDLPDRELLENYRRQGTNFQVEFVDPQVKYGLAQEFGVKSPKAVYLKYGDRKQPIKIFSNEQELLTEGQITNGIEQVLHGQKQPLVYFLQGHGEWPIEENGGEEASLSQAAAALIEKGYQVEPLNLAQQPQVPTDADAIAIFGPKRALFEGEVTALKEYLDRGGSLLLAIDPKTDPELDPILKEWGVELDSRLVIDASGSGSIIGLGPATPLVTQYGVHPITAEFGNSISVYPLARPIETQPKESIQAFPLLETNEESWAEQNLDSQDLAFDPNNDLKGPLTLGVALTKRETDPKNTDSKSESEEKTEASPSSEEKEASETPKSESEEKTEASPSSEEKEASETPKSESEEKTEDSSTEDKPDRKKSENSSEKKEARLIVFGNSTFASNGWFDQQLNRDVFINSVQWLAQSDESVLSIGPKQLKNRRLNLTLGQASLIGWLGIVIVPLLGLAIAGLMAWQRR